nr:trypsin-like peptidase domain-containing protein [Variovorax dokdonensis]
MLAVAAGLACATTPTPAAAACRANLALPWADAVAARQASVVEIRTLRLGRTLGESDFEPEIQPDADFSDRLSWPIPAAMALSEQRDLASGVIVGSDGLILSSAHVVAGVDEIRVHLADGRHFAGRLVGSDAPTDTAILKIDARGLPVATIGDSSQLRTGDEVAAIGSPFGFSGSLSSGVVSAIDRFIPGAGEAPFIQTDVAINPGSSGSPLFNRCGEVVAINSLIYSGNGAYMGIAFAVPINVAMRAFAQLRRDGLVHRARLGAQLQALTPALAASFGLDRANGVLVAGVEPDSPAARAGIAIGDVLVSLDDQAVNGLPQLLRQISGYRAGDVSRLTLWRRGEQKSARLTWAEEPDPSRRFAASPAVADEWFDGLGLRLAEPSPAAQRQLRTDGGLLVRETSGAARTEGLRPGDVVMAVNDERVTRVEQYRQAVERLPVDRPAALLILRDQRLIYVPVARARAATAR